MAIRGIGGERKAWSHPSASSLAASATHSTRPSSAESVPQVSSVVVAGKYS